MEIQNFKKQPSGSYEEAIFDVVLGNGLVLNGFCLCKSKNGHFYVKSSTFKDKRVLGDKPYVQSVDLMSPIGKDFAGKILAQLQDKLSESESFSSECPF